MNCSRTEKKPHQRFILSGVMFINGFGGRLKIDHYFYYHHLHPTTKTNEATFEDIAAAKGFKATLLTHGT